ICTSRQQPAGDTSLCSSDGPAWHRRSIALREVFDDECARAATAHDIAIRYELAQCFIDSIARYAEILRQRAARGYARIRGQRAAENGHADPIADPHVRGLIHCTAKAGNIDGEHGARLLAHAGRIPRFAGKPRLRRNQLDLGLAATLTAGPQGRTQYVVSL